MTGIIELHGANFFHREATITRDPKVARWFLEHGAKPRKQAPGTEDLSPQNIAVRYSTPEIMKVLFDAGGDPKKGTLLHAAATFDRLEMVEFLVESGADINAAYVKPGDKYYEWCKLGSSGGRTPVGPPLYTAIHFRRPGVVKLLLKLGADASIKEVHGRTVVEYARQIFENTVISHEARLDQVHASLGITADSPYHSVQVPYRSPEQYAADRAHSEEIVGLLEDHAKEQTALIEKLLLADKEMMCVRSRL